MLPDPRTWSAGRRKPDERPLPRSWPLLSCPATWRSRGPSASPTPRKSPPGHRSGVRAVAGGALELGPVGAG